MCSWQESGSGTPSFMQQDFLPPFLCVDVFLLFGDVRVFGTPYLSGRNNTLIPFLA